VYLDIDLEHLLPRVLSSSGLDYWESGQDYLSSADMYHAFVEHQTRLLNEFRRLAAEHAFTTVDARGPVPDVFQALCAVIEPVVETMSRDVELPQNAP
jgi:dTMP kinase